MKTYKTDLLDLRCCDCMEMMREMPDNSVDSIVTDPPYGLSFMGKKWDYDVPSVEIWAECLRVLKPGGHLLAFAGTRTQHRMAVRIEDAGFEIRDMIAWVYGSGFPKSANVSKNIDKAAGPERDKIPATGGLHKNSNLNDDGWIKIGENNPMMDSATPATEAARQWSGWGTALKPALEPITVARKPFKGTVAANVQEYGTGAINIDGCRVCTNGETPKGSGNPVKNADPYAIQPGRSGGNGGNETSPLGRWPANLIHDGSEEVVGLFPVTGASKATPRNNGEFKSVAKGRDLPHVTHGHDDNGGSAARFFYCAKASKADRNEGCEGMEQKLGPEGGGVRSVEAGSSGGFGSPRENHHPTVKPTALMQYLCRLVTPPGGVVLDPFMGSGSTGKAAMLEGFRFTGAEMESDFFNIAVARITAAVERVKRETAQQELAL